MRGSLSVFAAGLSLASASHSSPRRERREHAMTKRYTTLTAQYETQILSSDYLLSLNLWGMYSGSGSQTAVATSVSGDSVGWETTWSWSGGENSVKSYSNIAVSTGLGATLAEISSIPITWDWSASGGAASATFNVALDGWLSADPSSTWAVSSSVLELMVWTGKYGACTPAGSKFGSVTVGGLSWELWIGTVQNWAVYSFVAPSPITSYDGDVNDFFAYLIKDQGVSSSLYLTTLQAGTEPFVGTDVTVSTSAYSVKIISGGEVIPSTSASSLSSTTSRAAPSSTTIGSGTTSTNKAPSTTTGKVSTTVASSASASASSSSGVCGSAYAQCGGQSFSGSKCCSSGYACVYNNAYHSQCRPSSEASSVAATTAVASVSKPVLIASSSSTTTTVTYSSPSSSSSPVGSGSSLQTFAGAVNGISAPAVSTGGRGYLVADVTDGSSFYTLPEALSRSCDNQHIACARSFNALKNGTADFSTADCDSQNTQCHASA